VKHKQLVISTVLILCLAASVVAVAFAGKPQEVNHELNEIADMISGLSAFEHVEVLADDYYEGRLAGTTKCDEAADYIADKFHEYGLEPFGDGGTYFETFLITYWLASDWSLEILSPPEIAGSYDSEPMEYCASGNVTAELVYVGLGAPEDYNNLGITDMGGDIAFVLRGVYYFRDKVAWAYQHGAGGVIIFDHTYQALFAGNLQEPQEIPAVSLTRENGETTLEAMGFTVTIDNYLDPGDVSGTQLIFPTAHMFVDTVLEVNQPTKNVLGIIRGTQLNEYVLIGGHYDHLGVMKGEVYNGADDNVAGVAVVLEVARVLSIYAEEHPPRRSIIFAAWSAEEEGLYGSDYFVKTHRKLLPHIKIMLNLDMPGAGEWVNGAPRNNMYIEDTAHQYTDGDQPVYTSSGKEWAPRLVYNVAQLLIREGQIVLGANYAEPYYEKMGEYALYSGVDDVKVVEYIGRSDHEPFLLAGVPATAIFSGADKYPEYHKPGDETGLVDPEKLEISGKLVGCSAWKVSQHATQPAVAAEATVYPAIGAEHIPVLPAGEVA